MKSSNEHIRTILWTKEFSEFYQLLSEQTKNKFNYVIGIVQTEYVISSKFIKHLENTDFYEMRVSVGNNEYRTIIFTMNNNNIMLATKIVLLNAFLKKSTKDYKKQLALAEKILGGLGYEENR